jgi:hypothetical protein
MRTKFAIATAIAVATIVSAPAGAHTFNGSCATFGTVRTTHPLTPIVPAPDGFTLHETGACMGTLDGERLPTAGASVELTSSGQLLGGDDCFVGVALNAPMDLRFINLAGGVKTLFGSASVADVGMVMPGLFFGRQGGIATGFDYLGGGVETLQACQAGQVQVLNISTDMYTITPLVG